MDTVPTVFPQLLLILGIDLAGKDHCSNLAADAAASTGITIERRQVAFSGRPAQPQSSRHSSTNTP